MDLFRSLDIRNSRHTGLYVSLLLHGVLIAWVLYPSTPIFVRPSTTLAGKNGASTIYLYRPSQSASLTVAQELNSEENRHLLLPTATTKNKKKEVLKQPNLARTPQELHE